MATLHDPARSRRASGTSPIPSLRSLLLLTRLHRSLLRSLPLPFVAAFGTLMSLLLMQFLIVYLPDLVGRGLPASALVELVVYSLAYMVTLAVPMAWLIALLAAFGRLSESRAYLVVKSAGISLPRLAWPVFVVGLLLAGAMAYFNNEMLPEANHRMNGLWRDIRVSKPGFALTPGTFYTGIDGYAIRADAIPPDSSGLLVGVTVFETRAADGSQALLTAARARLQTQYGGQRLTMLLEDGEIHRRGGAAGAGPDKGAGARPGERYERLAFRRYRMAFDLSSLTGFQRRDETGNDARTDRSMRTSTMLAAVDSLRQTSAARTDSTAAILARRGRGTSAPAVWMGVPPTDTVGLAAAARGPAVLRGLRPTQRIAVYDLAQQRARAVRAAADAAASADRWDRQRIDRFLVEIYKKNSIALACLVFVLVGVPLGLSMARAGVGLVATLAVAVFLFYWVSLVQGEKLADRELLPPAVGMWAANVIVGALGLYLFAREARDPAWRDPVRWLAGRFARRGG